MGGLPTEDDKTLSYNSCSQVGEAVVFYSMTFGPILEKVKQLKATSKSEIKI
jgi:hypothetical protein